MPDNDNFSQLTSSSLAALMVLSVRVIQADGTLYDSFEHQIHKWKELSAGLEQLPDTDPRKAFFVNVKKAAEAYGTAAAPGPFKKQIDELHGATAKLLLDMQRAGRWDVCGAIRHQTITTMTGL